MDINNLAHNVKCRRCDAIGILELFLSHKCFTENPDECDQWREDFFNNKKTLREIAKEAGTPQEVIEAMDGYMEIDKYYEDYPENSSADEAEISEEV
jgi:hypothetical protein